mgnify:CR=1 FL=1
MVSHQVKYTQNMKRLLLLLFPLSLISQNFDEYTQDEIENKFNKILDDFSLIVEKVENKFLEHH